MLKTAVLRELVDFCARRLRFTIKSRVEIEIVVQSVEIVADVVEQLSIPADPETVNLDRFGRAYALAIGVIFYFRQIVILRFVKVFVVG